jgi:hypothetical protein
MHIQGPLHGFHTNLINRQAYYYLPQPEYVSTTMKIVTYNYLTRILFNYELRTFILWHENIINIFSGLTIAITSIIFMRWHVIS